MALANYFIEFTELKQLWFVISPHNPLKKKATLLPDRDRLELVELALGDDNRFVACDIEFRMPKPSYTIDTLTYLTEKYPSKEFILIMGADGLPTFHKWKNYEQIVARFHRFVYPRPIKERIDPSEYENITFLEEAPQMEISSSFIRKAIIEGKDVRHFLPPGVYDHIMKYHLYGS
jgi:nicotinate-nucleotide adenylyltransferase